jgi:cell division protein FtsZ
MGIGSGWEDQSGIDAPDLKILVVGCGGGGCNSITRLNKIGLESAMTIAINTDQRSLKETRCERRVLIGANYTHGLGAGGLPEVGEQCARNCANLFCEMFNDVDLTFIITGMGGGTGTGAAPVIAEFAQKAGSIVISIATMPFKMESGTRRRNAMMGLKRLNEYSNTVLVLDNNRLMQMVDNLPMNQALGVMDALVSELIKGLVDALTKPSLINLDFADLRTIIKHGGISTLLYAENADPEGVVQDAIQNPLLDVDIKGGTGALIHISGGSKLTLRRVHRIVEGLTKELDVDANVKFGVRTVEDDNETIRLIALVTGISELPPSSGSLDDVNVMIGKYRR